MKMEAIVMQSLSKKDSQKESGHSLPVSVSACSSTAMHFLTGSARWDFDSDVVSLGVLEKPARDWSEAFAIVVREVVIVRGRVCPQPGGWQVQTGSWALTLDSGQNCQSLLLFYSYQPRDGKQPPTKKD